MPAIFKKELRSSFGNRSAWIIIAAFSTICTLFLFFFENDSNIFDVGAASLQSFFVLAPWLLMFIIPALSMRTLADEQQSGTLQWLFSQPVSTARIVVEKFLAVWLIGILCLLPSAVYLYTVFNLGVPQGNMDFGAAAGSYLGLILLIGALSAGGVLASSLSGNQITAYLAGILLCFVFYFGIEQLASYRLLGGADYWLSNLGFYQHFLGFTRGLADSRDIFYFLLMISLYIALAIYFTEKKK